MSKKIHNPPITTPATRNLRLSGGMWRFVSSANGADNDRNLNARAIVFKIDIEAGLVLLVESPGELPGRHQRLDVPIMCRCREHHAIGKLGASSIRILKCLHHLDLQLARDPAI